MRAMAMHGVSVSPAVPSSMFLQRNFLSVNLPVCPCTSMPSSLQSAGPQSLLPPLAVTQAAASRLGIPRNLKQSAAVMRPHEVEALSFCLAVLLDDECHRIVCDGEPASGRTVRYVTTGRNLLSNDGSTAAPTVQLRPACSCADLNLDHCAPHVATSYLRNSPRAKFATCASHQFAGRAASAQPPRSRVHREHVCIHHSNLFIHEDLVICDVCMRQASARAPVQATRAIAQLRSCQCILFKQQQPP